MYYFCTYFDQRYLPKGLALFRSLTEHCRSFRLWVLCLDQACYDTLKRLGYSNLYPIALEDFEKGNAELLQVKPTRTLVEYYFTCTPFLPRFVLGHHPEVELITYLDADLFFFADPGLIFREIGDASVAITEHRFFPMPPGWEQYGAYNVGWITFRRDANALACLQWWGDRCLEWCYDRVEDGRFGDQKYLDAWPAHFAGVRVLRQKGANVAPWNFLKYRIRRCHGHIWVDEDPLVFFHFHHLRTVVRGVYDPALPGHQPRAKRNLIRLVYRPYLRTLSDWQFWLGRFVPSSLFRTNLRYETSGNRSPVPFWRLLIEKVRPCIRIGRRIFLRRLLVSLNGCVSQFFVGVHGNKCRQS